MAQAGGVEGIGADWGVDESGVETDTGQGALIDAGIGGGCICTVCITGAGVAERDDSSVLISSLTRVGVPETEN